MRLAILGGSFDPPHVGHLLAATDACEQLALDRLVFVPAATQPLKAGLARASADQRLAMVRLLVEGDPRFEVSALEVERGGLSYTVDTLAHFEAQHPDAARFLLLGSDVLGSFARWRDPERIVALAQPVLLTRHGDPDTDVPRVLRDVRRLPTRRIDVSSTEIRERIRAGRPIRGFVTDAVAAYIGRGGLYR